MLGFMKNCPCPFNGRSNLFRFIVAIVLLSTTNIHLRGQDDFQGERISFDEDWKFILGNCQSDQNEMHLYGKGFTPYSKSGRMVGVNALDFDDSSWRQIKLPHDWAIALEFINEPSTNSHGYKPVGWKFPENSLGWYRKKFELPAKDSDKQIFIKFDGVFRDCDVWINGFYLGNNQSGYIEFMYDVTDMLNYGAQNLIVVKVDASQYEGWWYEGAGIYRHTWLIKKSPVHIEEHGTYITTRQENDRAFVFIQTAITNVSGGLRKGKLELEIFDEEGNEVGRNIQNMKINPGDRSRLLAEIEISKPLLWSLHHPHLYTLVSTVSSDDGRKDQTRNTFGVRTVVFDAQKGFLLNGKAIKIKGACMHQDHAGVGVALPDRLHYYRIERLKSMGCNAYRSAHHPPAPEILKACDELGMLVVPENRLLNGGAEYISQFKRLLYRDRNHPSVIIWSIGNEEMNIQDSESGRRVAETFKRIQRVIDPSRLITFAGNNGNTREGVNEVVDVRGVNYMGLSDLDAYHDKYPDQPIIGTEEECVKCTRGQYQVNAEKGFMSDYDKPENASFGTWSVNAHEWWSYFDERDWLSGAFIWTGFDYKGETAPYKWPCVNSHNGVMDMCGFTKNNYYYYKSWWTDEDVLHLFPHRNWDGKIGEKINVWCYSNCTEVELFLNGKSLGKQQIEKNSHAEWDVSYEPGILEARGLKDGNTLIKRLETTGTAAEIKIQPDRTEIIADGKDLSIVTVTALDLEGRMVPNAGNFITFHLEGPGKIIGVGNGNPSSHEPDKVLNGNYHRELFNGKCQVIIQSGHEPGKIVLKATADELKTAESIIISNLNSNHAGL